MSHDTAKAMRMTFAENRELKAENAKLKEEIEELKRALQDKDKTAP